MAMLTRMPRRRFMEDGQDDAGIGAPVPGAPPDDALVGDAIQSKLNAPVDPGLGVQTKPPTGIGALATGALSGGTKTGMGIQPKTKPPVGAALGVGGKLGDEREAIGPPTGADAPNADDATFSDDRDMGLDMGEDTGVPDAGAPDLGWRKSLSYGDQGTLIGFRTDGYEGDDEEANTVKNTFGKIASRYKHAPSQVDAILQDPDFRRAFPNATKVEGGANDKIDFGGVLSFFDHGEPVGVVDVQKAADPGADVSEGWTWQPEGGGGMDAGGMGGMGGGGFDMGGLEGLTEGDQLAEIMAQIDALAQGRNPEEAEAVRRMLEGDSGEGSTGPR